MMKSLNLLLLKISRKSFPRFKVHIVIFSNPIETKLLHKNLDNVSIFRTLSIIIS